MCEFLPADYAVCGLTVLLAVTGAFRGFSGTLAFLLATAVAIPTGLFGWGCSASLSDVLWMRALGTLVAVLLAFGIVRVLVRKLVGGILRQPSDAVFGFLLGLLVGALILVVWARTGFHCEYSVLVSRIAPYVR